MKVETTVLHAGLLLAALLASGANGADLTLYDEDDYQGRALNVVIDERELSVRNFDKRASSVVVEKGAWILCSGEDYAGTCITLEPGRYPSLQSLGLNDAVASVRRRDLTSIGEFKGAETIARNAARPSDIELFARDDYGGARHLVDISQADVAPQLMRSQAESAVIAHGKWELCSEPQFRGTCVTLGPGKYASLQMYGLAGGAASVRRAVEPPQQ